LRFIQDGVVRFMCNWLLPFSPSQTLNGLEAYDLLKEKRRIGKVLALTYLSQVSDGSF